MEILGREAARRHYFPVSKNNIIVTQNDGGYRHFYFFIRKLKRIGTSSVLKESTYFHDSIERFYEKHIMD
jgi:hypothetical protein